MSKGTTFDNDLLKLIFNGTAIANLADNAASSPLTVLYVSLHTADPSTQSSNEISYTGYARIAVNRNSGGWVVTSNVVSPAADITFGIMTAGAGGTVTHAAVGTAISGTGKILYKGTLTPNIAVLVGVTPKISSGSTITET